MAAGVKIGKMGTFELNPRGNIWFQDDTTFGHKLLLKMGWSKGKGLGKNEDGITENVKVLKKDNLAGVGYKNDTYISVSCIEYENILKKLQQHFKNKESFSTANLESLEQRSRSSKSRLHYQKFIKGKDLFRCSEKDMKCIFLENPQNLSDETKNRTDGEITTVKSELSISDYFAQKMQQKLGICPKTEDVAENITVENSCSNLSKKRKIFEKAEVEKKVKLDYNLNKSSGSPSKREMQSNPEVFSSCERKNKKSKIIKVTKKKKNLKIKTLKSCIKLDSTSNSDKNRKVCFNEHVSYKILDDGDGNTTENNAPLNNDCDEESDMVKCLQIDINTNNNREKEDEITLESDEITSKLCNENSSHLCESKNKIKKEAENDEEKQGQDRIPAQGENSDDDPECLNLPVSSSYNCWLESQRTALKMKLYRNMIKKLKRHNVLRTTNLLDIKGYGNWGFKL